MSNTETPKTPRFRLSGSATVKHLNVRKEGDEDDQVLAVDVKLEVKKVDAALCDYFDDALRAFLWRGDTESMIARNLWLAPVSYGHMIEAAEIQIGHLSFWGDAKKFQLQPHDGGVLTVVCSVSVEPTSDEVAALANMVQNDTQVQIIGPAGLFDAEGGAQ